jgi:two-component system, OmpR family, sensor histidine kinase CiaH
MFLQEKPLKPIEDMLNKQSRFVSDAAHELKTPLTGMKTELEVSLRDKNKSVESLQTSQQKVLESVDEMTTLVRNLLIHAKFSYGVSEKIEPIILSELLDSLLDKLEPKIKSHSLVIYKEYAPESLKVSATKNDLNTLFKNLLDNAIKYSKQSNKISIRIEKKGALACVQVTDKGSGIAKEDLPNIFEPFYRSDKSRAKNEVDGFGLGLTIAKDIVEKYKGKISVMSEIGKGTSFVVNLPVSE